MGLRKAKREGHNIARLTETLDRVGCKVWVEEILSRLERTAAVQKMLRHVEREYGFVEGSARLAKLSDFPGSQIIQHIYVDPTRFPRRKKLIGVHNHGGERGNIVGGVLVNVSWLAADEGGEFGFGHEYTNNREHHVKFAEGTFVTFPPNWDHWVTEVKRGIREQFVFSVVGEEKDE